jgi:hypothetical protein
VIPTHSLTSQARPGNPAGVAPTSADPVEPVESVLSVVKGEPTAEELAALTAVVLSLGNSEAPEPVRSSARQWFRRQQLQLAPKPGPGAWKRSRG